MPGGVFPLLVNTLLGLGLALIPVVAYYRIPFSMWDAIVGLQVRTVRISACLRFAVFDFIGGFFFLPGGEGGEEIPVSTKNGATAVVINNAFL